MLRRDFTKSNKEYFKQNKKVLISIAVFLVVGILIFSIFGLNGNFEIKGYNEFSINVNETIADKFVSHRHEIGNIINSRDGKFDTMLIYGEGDDTKFVVRYMKNISNEDVVEINRLVAEKLEVDVSAISSHIAVSPVVKSTDYVYTATAILIIVLVASIFAYARYNGASSLAVMLACLLGTIGFMSLGAILRLSIGMSYFAMLIILNMLIAYLAINIFESMHKSSWLVSGDYGTAMEKAINSSKFRMITITVGLMLIGLLLVLFAPSTIKYVALNLMFMAVIILAVSLYVIPFTWNVFITLSRKRDYKIKVSAVENKK